MDTRTGDLYQSKDAARAAGVPEEFIVEISGTQNAIDRLSEAVKVANTKLHKRLTRVGRSPR